MASVPQALHSEVIPKGSPARTPPLWRRMVAGLGAGLALATCFPPYGVPVLLPAAIAALLIAVRRASLRESLYTGLICGLAFYWATLFWLANLFGPVAISLIAIESLFPAPFCALFVGLRARLAHIPGWFLAALLWTAIEYYRSELFVLHFGWMGLGYSAIHSRVFAAIAAWVGSYGISFLIVALGGALAVAAQTPSRPGLGISLLAAWIVLLMIPGRAPKPGGPLRV